RVDKIVGPGNIYVALAKTRVVGEVGIDMMAGPSEVVVVADAAADPDWIAADLLAQAEHDPMARAVLITDAPALTPRVEKALAARLDALPRRQIAAAALRDHGALILAESLERAVELANRLAPEHLELTGGPGRGAAAPDDAVAHRGTDGSRERRGGAGEEGGGRADMSEGRQARVERKTKETEITLSLGLDGTGASKVKTPIPFFSHMLEAFAKHGLVDLAVE